MSRPKFRRQRSWFYSEFRDAIRMLVLSHERIPPGDVPPLEHDSYSAWVFREVDRALRNAGKTREDLKRDRFNVEQEYVEACRREALSRGILDRHDAEAFHLAMEVLGSEQD